MLTASKHKHGQTINWAATECQCCNFYISKLQYFSNFFYHIKRLNEMKLWDNIQNISYPEHTKRTRSFCHYVLCLLPNGFLNLMFVSLDGGGWVQISEPPSSTFLTSTCPVDNNFRTFLNAKCFIFHFRIFCSLNIALSCFNWICQSCYASFATY